MTAPLQGVDRRFESGWAHHATMVEWYNWALPTLRPGFDPRSSHSFLIGHIGFCSPSETMPEINIIMNIIMNIIINLHDMLFVWIKI